MRRMTSSFFPTLAATAAALLLSVTTGTFASSTEPGDIETPETGVSARILGAALADHSAYDRLAWLTDRIGPRITGSANLQKAIEWTADEFRKDGASNVHTEPAMVPHWVRGNASARIVLPTEHPVAITALGGSIATPAGGVRAEVIAVADFEELHALGKKVEGKIVLYTAPILRNGGGIGHGYGWAAKYRVAGAVEAAKQGAVGSLNRSLGTADYRLPHTGMMRYDDEVPKIPTASISAEDTELIQRLLASGEKVVMEYDLSCRNEPMAESANVVAEIPGREKPEEVVILACHLDSWDMGTGAIDDGAGCTMVMESLRILHALGLHPRRTVRGVLYVGEETGSWGGKTYARAHGEEAARIVAALESDAGAGAPQGFGVSAGDGGVAMVRAMARTLAAIGADTVKEGGGGADISPLRSFGVPQIGLRQDTTYYFDWHHTMADTLDKVDPDALAKNVAAMAVIGYSLADAEDTLPRIPVETGKE